MNAHVATLPLAVLVTAIGAVAGKMLDRTSGRPGRTFEKVFMCAGACVGLGLAVWLGVKLANPALVPFRGPDFDACFPGEPTETIEKQSTPRGVVETHTYSSEPRFETLGSWRFDVARVDYPAATIASLTSEQAFTQLKTFQSKLEGVTNVVDREVESHGVRGRQISFTRGTRRHVGQYFLLGTRLYAATIDAPTDELLGDERVKRFFDAFHIR